MYIKIQEKLCMKSSNTDPAALPKLKASEDACLQLSRLKSTGAVKVWNVEANTSGLGEQ